MNGQSTVGAFFAGRDIVDIVIVADGRVPPTRITPFPAKRARERGCPVRCARSLRESAPTASLHIVGQSTVGAFFAGRDIADTATRADECAPPTRIAPLPAKRARERGCPVLGGVQYLFVRGMQPGDSDTGIHVDRPSVELIERLDALFDAEGVAA